MRLLLAALLIPLILITSGCTRETGNIVINFTDLNLSEKGITIAVEDEEAPEESESNETINETAEETAEPDEEPSEPCDDVVCEESITTCPDGTAMTCENSCDNETGECSSCIPDCTGHEEEPCELDCDDCEFPDQDECECITILNCDGNEICEPEEWPDGGDCSGFDECEDGDDCTLDVFNFNSQSCSHVETCCDDENDCTLDTYNYTTQSCTHEYICCGNEVCEPDNNETEENCPTDCFEEGEEQGDILIVSIDAAEEFVFMEGYDVDMTNWTIEDARPDISSHVYKFPDGFIIQGPLILHTYGNETDNNATDLFWGSGIAIWNNDHDNATLRNALGEEISFYEY